MKLHGVFIAPLTPLDEEGRVDPKALQTLLAFLSRAEVDGFCIGGATSEYPHFELSERKNLISVAKQSVKPNQKLLVSVGHSSPVKVLELIRHCEQEGVDALLLPMPHFYPYAQKDLDEFCRRICEAASLPCLLYNLPEFTTPLLVETTTRLLREVPNLVGMKDSSGDRHALAKLEGACDRSAISLLVGQDGLLYEALEAGWDGVITGLGNFCPELFVLFCRGYWRGEIELAQECRREIRHLEEQLKALPFPWAIRYGVRLRSIPCGSPVFPLSEERQEAVRAFQDWLETWLKERLAPLVGSSFLGP